MIHAGGTPMIGYRFESRGDDCLDARQRAHTMTLPSERSVREASV